MGQPRQNKPVLASAAKVTAFSLASFLLQDGLCDYEAPGDCQHGVDEYTSEFIDPIRTVLNLFSAVPVALIIEPDSLPNLVTNADNDPRCGSDATNAAYRKGVTYAVEALHSVPTVSLYLDAAHG